MSALFDKSIDVLSKSLDFYSLRQGVIADNIANAETPFYKAREVEFETDLARAIEADSQGLSSNAVDSLQARITQDIHSEIGQDRNTVDMDREMAKMTRNDIQYSAASQAISRKFAILKYAISEGSER